MSVGSLVPRDVPRRPDRSRAGASGLFSGSTVAVLAAFMAIAAVLRFHGLGHQGFWYDEADTAMLLHLSPGKMLGLLPQSESTPPLYYCIAWVWVRIFGDHEAGLRSLSALAGVLVVPVAYAATARLVGGSRPARHPAAPGGAAPASSGCRAGLIAAALTACSPLLIWYSQEARAYELMVLLTAVSLLCFAHAREAPTGRVMTLWTVACALAMATHYYALVAVVPQALWLLAVHRRRRRVQIALAVLVVVGLALLPLAIAQNATLNDAWISHANFALRLRQIIPQLLIGTGAPDRTLVKFVAMGLAIVALGLLALRGRTAERRGARVAAALAVGGFGLALLFVAAGFDDLITRNIIALWLPAAIVVAAGLATLRAKALGMVLAAGLCATGIFATAGIAAQRSLQRPDWRYVARALGTAPPAAPGRAILIQHYEDLLPLSLYLPGLRDVHAPVRVRELDVISMTSPQQPLCWWGAACNLIPSQMQRRYDIAGFHVASRRHVLQWTILRLVAPRPVMISRGEVARALHTTTLRRDDLIDQPG